MLKKLAVAAVVAALLGLVLLFWEFDSPELGRAVAAQAREATGVELEAERFRLGLLSGLVVEGAQAAGEIPGGRYRLELDRLVFEHRLLPLLHGTVAVDRIQLVRPRLELVATPAPAGSAAPAPPAEAAAGAGLALEIREIAVEDASLELRDETGEVPPASLEGVSLVMRDLAFDPTAATPMVGVSAAGEVRVDRIGLETTELREARGAFALAEGRFETQRVGFRTPEGEFSVDFAADLSRVPLRYEMALRGDPLDLNAASGAEGAGGFGPATFEFEGRGAGTASKGLTGDGSVTLAAGTVPRHPVVAGIEQAIGRTVISGAPYEEARAGFRIADDVLSLEPLELRTPELVLVLGGRVGLDAESTLDLAVAVRTPREGVVVEGVGEDVLNTLADEEGWLTIPIRVTGTSQEPRVRPDTKALLDQAKAGLGRAAKKSLTDKLKGLFGRDEQP